MGMTFRRLQVELLNISAALLLEQRQRNAPALQAAVPS
jgi:hypothetical protein